MYTILFCFQIKIKLKSNFNLSLSLLRHRVLDHFFSFNNGILFYLYISPYSKLALRTCGFLFRRTFILISNNKVFVTFFSLTSLLDPESHHRIVVSPCNPFFYNDIKINFSSF